MINKLIVSAPLSHLSLAQVSFNIIRELYKRKVQCVIFPKGGVDLSAYKLDVQFAAWIEQSINKRFEKVDRKIPSLAIWHINDSQFKPSDNQFLFTFHETDSPTSGEVNIVNQQNHTFFSSSWSVDNFQTFGAQNVSYIPLGLDEDFKRIENRLTDDATQWLICGKTEPLRKMTALKIQAWVKKYGGNAKHFLNLSINNPFVKPEDMNGFFNQVFQGNKPFNVKILPHLTTNAEMNLLYNATDIDLSGFSRAEGHNIPAHTCTALGKWSIVSNCSAHKDWATKDNSILIEPIGKIKAVDGLFFHENAPFSSGNMFDFNMDDLVIAMEKAEKLAKTLNVEGTKLVSVTYKDTVDKILEKISL